MDENEKLAKKAFELFQESLQNNQLELARLYLLNAVTHDPEQEYIEAYVSLIEKHPEKERYNVVNQVSNILSVAALQGKPENIPIILSVQEKLTSLADISLEAPQKNEPKEESLKDFYAEYAWDKIIAENKQIDPDFIKSRNIAMQTIIESEQLTVEEQNSFEKEFEYSLSYMEYLNKKQQFEENINLIQKKLENDNPFFVQIEALCKECRLLLDQLCILNIPKELEGKNRCGEINNLNDLLSECEESLDERKNSPSVIKLCNEGRELCRELPFADSEPTLGKGGRTLFIEKIRDFLVRTSSIAQTLSSEKLSNSLSEVIKAVSKIGREVEVERYAAYQRYCANLCASAIKNFHDVTWVWEKDANEILKKCQIANIDESLLSPECAEIYHSARGMLQEKLDKENCRIEFQVACVNSPKVKLESF
jgi:hypothetical protein